MSLVVVEAARETDHDLSSLHSVMSAASSAPARLWGQLRERLGLTQLVTGYGMTETSAATTFTLPGDRVDLLVETVGRPKLGGVAGPLAEYRTVDPESGEPLAPAAEGELAVRGTIVTHGYHDAAEETAEVLGEDGWLRSATSAGSASTATCASRPQQGPVPLRVGDGDADRGRVPADRARRRLQAHVVPIPHDRMGEVGVAFVVPAAGATPDAADLIEHCHATLARFKVPEHVVFLGADELPLTSSGKVRKFLLARRAREELLPSGP